jgi:hypothetical protein
MNNRGEQIGPGNAGGMDGYHTVDFVIRLACFIPG